MKKLAFHLLGRLEIQLDGSPIPEFKSRKSQALLCYLAVTGKQHSREWLSGLFWGDMPENKARGNLSQSLTTIRRWFQPYLLTSRHSVSIDPTANYWTDVGVLEASLDQEIAVLYQAAQLYQGDFLEGFYLPKSPEFEFWMLEERAHCREIVLQVLDRLARHYIAQSSSGLPSAIEIINQRLAIEPWHEETHRTLMRLYALTGQRSSALKQFEKCRQILLQELGVEPGTDTSNLYELIRSSSVRELQQNEIQLEPGITKSSSQEPVRDTGFPVGFVPTKIPHQSTQFIGREQELESLRALIIGKKSRLVTITGLGGVGKTRLAIEFSKQCSQRSADQNSQTSPSEGLFPDGVFFISLEQIRTGDSILPAVAEGIDFRLDRQDEELFQYLETKRMLLILDNFEHLLDFTGILSALISGTTGVQLLVTSRESLGVYGEQLFPLRGLKYPDDPKMGIENFSAVQLFLNSALRKDPQFTLTKSDQVHLLKLCHLVGGLPLALELAATWTVSMPIAAITAKIQEDFQFLTAKIGNLPARHRSIRAVIEGTFDRLPPGEKMLFSQLAVFQGGFSLDSAQTITGADYDKLTELVNKSLIRFNRSTNRYDIHPLLKLFGMELIKQDQCRLQKTEARHSQYYCKWFADQTEPADLVAQGQKTILSEMTAEIENTRQAWQWALKNGEYERLIGKTTSIGLYFIWRGGYLAGERLLKSFLDNFDTRIDHTDKYYSLLLAGIYNWLGFFTYNLGAKSYALSLLRKSADLLNSDSTSEFDSRAEKAHNLMNFARVNPSLAPETRNDYVTKARTLYREVNHPYGLPFALTSSGRFAILDGELEAADRYLQESLDIYRRNGNYIGLTISLTGLGNLAFVQNNYSQARKIFQEAIAIADEFNSPERVIVASLYLGTAHLFSGQFNRAITILEGCEKLCKERGLQPYQGTALYYLAYSHLHYGNYELALESAQSALLLAELSGDQEIIAQSKIMPAAVELVNRNYAHAYSVFQASLEKKEQNKSGSIVFGEDFNVFGLAYAQSALGDADLARRCLIHYLHDSVNSHRMDKTLYALSGLAKAYFDLGEQDLAFDLLSYTTSYPFIRNSYWIRDLLINPIREQLPMKIGHLNNQLTGKDIWDLAGQVLSNQTASGLKNGLIIANLDEKH